MKCRCADVDRLEGAEAEYYIRDHLRKVSTDPQTWEVLLECPNTGMRWLERFPKSELHGGGPPVLDRLNDDVEASK